MLRADFKAVKFLYQQYGLKLAMDWQRVPFIDLRGYDTDLSEIMRPVVGSFDHLPFIDATYYSAKGEHGAVIYRLRRVVELGTMPEICAGLGWKDPIEVRAILGIDGVFSFFNAAVDNATGLGVVEHRGRLHHLAQGAFQGVVHIAATDARFLAQCPEHLVEVKPLHANQNAKARKTAAKKPWLQEDLSQIILLDPAKARQHGHRIDRGGTHASPIPHQRRGHWRQLRAPRFKEKRPIWVRPTWIGDSEWIHQGRSYKVLQPCNDGWLATSVERPTTGCAPTSSTRKLVPSKPEPPWSRPNAGWQRSNSGC